MDVFSKLKNLTKRRFFKIGIPFLIFVVGGSFALSKFTTVRYEVHSHYQNLGLTDELKEKLGFNKKPKTLEDHYKDLIEDTDIDNWKNVRGPRPWESDNKEYMSVIEERIADEQKKKNKIQIQKLQL